MLVELREEERHKNAQVLDVMPERGSSTVLGRTAATWPVPSRAGLAPTHGDCCLRAARASCSAAGGPCSRRVLS
ncbi:MAG TPA: hypothetical protein VK584_12445 [Streptosporangiaceae bacterium]|nr:hypothetical protein [Streptosporangiaceae bacterium]